MRTSTEDVSVADSDVPKRSVWSRLTGGREDAVPHVGVIALALAVMVFWYTPAVLYSSNTRQFSFALRQALPILAVLLVVSVAVLVAVAMATPARTRRYYGAVLAALVAYLWVTGFLFVPDYGLLDGVVDLPAFSPAPLFLAAAIVVAAAALMTRIRPSVLSGASALLVVAQLAHVTVLVVSDPNPVRPSQPAGAESLYDLGPQNVIVLLLDALQSDVFAEVVEARPDLAKGLEGFTYFPNTMGVGPTTYGSVPTIHSGRLRSPGQSMDEHFNRSIAEDSFETELSDAGWTVTHLNPVGGVCPGRVDGCFTWDPSLGTSSWDPVRNQAAVLFDLTLFRLAPPVLKATVYNEDRWRVRRAVRSVSLQESSDTLIREFTRKVQRSGDENTLKFLHLQSTHAPATRDADCSLLEEPVSPITREAARDLTECALSRVAALVVKLKDLRAYDSTAVVMLADHGFGNIPSARVTDERWSDLVGIANPLLAVKPPDADGPMRTSDAQMSLADVKPIVCAFAGDCGDPSVSWASPDPHRPRRFTMYVWHDRFWHASTLKDERHYEVRGPMMDASSWTDLGPTSVPRVAALTFDDADRADHFGFGWRPVEADGYRWAVGSGASLNLDLPHDVATRLTFDVGTLPELSDQTMSIKVNLDPIGEQRISADTGTVTFLVPPGVADRGVDELLLVFSTRADPGTEGNRHERRARSFAARFDELRIAYER